MRYIPDMTSERMTFKPIVAAVLLVVGFSLPLGAQESADPVTPDPVTPDLVTPGADEAAAVAPTRLDRLHEQLLEAADAFEADRIADQIITEWSKSGSPAMDLLLRRGEEALELGDFVLAAEHFTAAIDHDPDFAEAWHGRAAAYYSSGLIGPALDDLREVLVLNPRHFDAMRGFGVILEELGQLEEARAAYLRAQAIHPRNPELARSLERLDIALEGMAI